MRENAYQSYLKGLIEQTFLGAVVIKNDSGYRQGIPDLLVLFENKWAMLEVKVSQDAATQPNQEYYIHLFDCMSYATFVYPENEEEVLHDLQLLFTSHR